MANLNTTGLADHVQTISNELIVKSVFDNKTAEVLKAAKRVIPGIKGKARLNLLDSEVVLQDGSDCGRSPLGDVTITEAFIEVVPLKDEKNLCPKALEKAWTADLLSKGQTYTNLLFAEEIMQDRAGKIAEANEKLMWKGDTSITGTSNLNKFDGYVKLIKAGAYTNLSGATGSTNVEKLQAVWASMPAVETDKDDFVAFVGNDFYKAYKVALANKNIYQATDDTSAFGTTMKLIPVGGLNGTSEVIATSLSNLVMGTDLEGEEDKAELTYSIETKNFYQDFHYALGVTAVNIDKIGYVQY